MALRLLSRIRPRRRALLGALAITTGLAGLGGMPASPASASTLPASALTPQFARVLVQPFPMALVLDVQGSSTAKYAPVIMYFANSGANQTWFFIPQPNGTYLIQNRNSNMCLTTNGQAGSQLYQYTCIPGEPHQQWATKIGPTYDGYRHVIKNPAYGLCVDAYQWSSKVDGWPCNGGENQYFS